MQPARIGLATLCAHAAHSLCAERAFWCSDDGTRLVAGPRAIAPREVEWRWVEERRLAGPGVTRRGRGRLRRALRDGRVAELWLVRGPLAVGAGTSRVGGVLGLEFAREAPRRTDELALRGLWDLAQELEQRAHESGAIRNEHQHATRGRHAARLVHDLRHELTLARVLAASADGTAGRGELERVLDGCAELCARALTAPDDLAAPETLRVAHVLRRAVEDVTRSREHARELVLEIEADEGLIVSAERTTLARVLANALANAVEATPHGGRVRLGARAVEGGVELAIEDQGRGIQPRRLADLTRARAAGCGVHGHGFDSACDAARALGSELIVSSRVGAGSGTRVSLTVPSARRREAIVLVDPLPERRRALATALERAGWGSCECADSRAALRALAGGPRAVAIARGAAAVGRPDTRDDASAGLAALARRARALGLPCFVLGSTLEPGDARERAGTLTARLSEAVGS